ncbi:MAG: chorismate-binding protein [Candidatus Nitricoxidivorans perseverans]|uniref:Chorismate-binding protein n=1 Tax=Candidatus Nitricoxidivorans perseverans TaxID=2975601 RepID=A0AA49FK52_9PROT|nr:MAG: chorismate-binding protein [Candidatus Nitricoxidivorans perseverans]
MKARIDFPEDGGRLRLAFSNPVEPLTAHRLDEVAAVIAEAERQARAGRWAVGFVAYEAAPAFDAALKVRPPAGFLPLAAFAVYDAPFAAEIGDRPRFYESQNRGLSPISCCWRMETPRGRVLDAIAGIRRRIAEGDLYQVNLTTRLRAAFEGDGGALFEALRESQPDGWCAHLEDGGWEVLSVSPELFFDWQGGTLTTRPMKGTASDAASATAMRESPKEQAENLMIVDLLRNDLSRIAKTGTVQVPQLFEVVRLPTAWQMTSSVRCETRAGTGLADVFGALFPCGSVTGAPKVAAMAAIAELEDSPRGAYCGAIGLIRPGGHATFAVGIRTVVLDRSAGMAECGVGSGIVFDSHPEDEFDEWLVKRRFLLRATAGFDLIETLRLEDGAYWLRDRHLARMEASAEYFGFPFDRMRIEGELAAQCGRSGIFRVRLLLDRRGMPRTECFALEPAREEVIVALAKAPVEGEREFLRHKTTERGAYGPFDPPEGVFDTLLWNAAGELTEFTRGNVVVEMDGRQVTPPLSCGPLPGVLRAEMLARGEIAERVVKKDELPASTGLWFINSVRGRVKARLV